MTEAYPLYWPEHHKRTPSWKRQRSRFKTGFGMAVRLVVGELRRLGAQLPVVSTDVPLRRDGLPLATAKRVDDPGVAVYFKYKDRQMCMTCDRWDKVEDNIYAIAKSIDAMRGIERWGSGDMLEAAFSGFTALPPPRNEKAWREVLGTGSLETVEENYRRLAKQHHPDAGGDGEMFKVISAAIQDARKELS